MDHGSWPLGVVITDLAARGLLYATKARTARQTLGAALGHRCEPTVAMVVAWALEGQRTGHEWHVCDTCGEARLMAYERGSRCAPQWPGSGNTPKCKGRMARVSARPLTTEKVKEALRT
jgi:hypothetical protein